MACNDSDIADTFRNIIAPKKHEHECQTAPKQKKRKVLVKEMHYIPYTAPDHHTEQGWVFSSAELKPSSRPSSAECLNVCVNILSAYSSCFSTVVEH
jgi:hypothetical protein